MSVQDRTLIKAAWSARDRSYSPYSKFKVGAAIENAHGQIFTGCNVEVANYGCTVCAERTAILKAVSEGALQPGELMKVAVAAESSTPTAPCGSCRQVIEEFAHPEARVLISGEPGKLTLDLRHSELLPHAFNGRTLGIQWP